MKMVEIPILQPDEEQVFLKIEACGVCHGDSKVIKGASSSYPRIPGHEVIGIIEELNKNGKLVRESVSVGTADMVIQLY